MFVLKLSGIQNFCIGCETCNKCKFEIERGSAATPAPAPPFYFKCKFEIECVFDMHSNVNHTLYLPRFFLFGSGISKKIDLKK